MIAVGAGSNLERERCLAGAVARLRERFCNLRCSTVYESAAIGFDGPAFYNLVMTFETDASLTDVRDYLREVEDEFGRDRSIDMRTLDLDLLLFGDRVDADERLPRDDIERYAFVLRPLAELVPLARHPSTGECYEAMWASFNQQSQPLIPVAFQP